MKFSYRPYQAGDEVAINELYHAVTGRVRTVEQHAWQWLQTPAGQSEMWLIEAHLADGSTKLIGHHGVMALNFTYQGIPIRVGKTENTMVLPEFREKILYPRYEKIFLSQYEHKFHALFSTMGPPEAIRLRKAMGYEATQNWQRFYIGSEPSLSLSLIRNKFFKKESVSLYSKLPEEAIIKNTTIKTHLHEKIDSNFDFDSFWKTTSNKYTFTPSREKSDLLWKFWSNPYREHVTLILDNENLGIAVCTFSKRKTAIVYIEDIYCEIPQNLSKFLEIIQLWSREALNIKNLESITTTDSLKYFSSKKTRLTVWAEKHAPKKYRQGKFFMPRKITLQGIALDIKKNDEWFVTPYFFEGR